LIVLSRRNNEIGLRKDPRRQAVSEALVRPTDRWKLPGSQSPTQVMPTRSKTENEASSL
jgi:hypothetical protein